MKQQKRISSGLLLLVLGGAMTYLGSSFVPTASADTLIDPSTIVMTKVVFIVGTILVLVSFVILALSTIATTKE